ncbi:MAG: hypothetical protein ACLR5O_00190 [Romboutsia timonensis]|uniref:hypothetical protein n=1 Tax=Romboutsia timonensis TaxID=1776391 RepID=UPI0039A273AD
MTAKKGDVILKQIYPKVSNKIKNNQAKYKQCLARFVDKRSTELYDIAPCDRIYFGIEDLEDYYKSTGINEKEVESALANTYYADIGNFNPRAAKDPFTIAQLCVIRYYFLQKKQKELEVSCIYLAFSGKFYPSIHHGSFPKVQPSEYRHVMEYVINNELSNKYDIKSQGSVFKAILSICNTWIKTYDDRLKSFEDEDCVYLIQQLHDRIKSFMKNIAEIYYRVYADKDKYLAYSSDNLSDDNYRIADNDSLRIERCVENTMSYINNTSVDYKLCKMASDSNVKTDEVKSIIESILNNNDNVPEIKELVRIIIAEYFVNSKTKDVRDIDFITKSITPKPNTKNTNILREKQIIEGWLCENSSAYMRRRSREATKNSYFKSVLTYFVLLIHNSNK